MRYLRLRGWTIAALPADELRRGGFAETEEASNPDDLLREMSAVALLQDELWSAFERSAAVVLPVLAESPSLVVLVPWRSPPPYGTRNDGPVGSFLCSL